MAENDTQLPTDRRRKRTVVSHGSTGISDYKQDEESGETVNKQSDEEFPDISETVPQLQNGANVDSYSDQSGDENLERPSQEVKKPDTVMNEQKNNDVPDIIYDDTKPKRLSNPKALKLDLGSHNSHAFQESINVLISPDDSESPTRRKRKPLHTVKSESAIADTRHHLTGVSDDKDAEARSRRETVPERRTVQSPQSRLHYDRSPESCQRKVSSPVQRLMAKNSNLAAAAAANSKDRKGYNQPRRKISSDARLEHRYIDGQLTIATSQAPKRKVSFDTSALINGNRVTPLNDEFSVKEVPEPFPEEEIEPVVYSTEIKSEYRESPKLNIPRVILTTDNDESFEQSDSDKDVPEETNSELSEGEEGYASGCDNKGYIKDEDEFVRTEDKVNQEEYRGTSSARRKRLTPISDPSYRFDEVAVIPHKMDHLQVNKKVSTCSLPSNIGRRISNDDQGTPKSILKVRREDAESINSEDSVAVKNFKVRKDSIALFMDQHGTVAMQELRKEHSQRSKCFGKNDIKEVKLYYFIDRNKTNKYMYCYLVSSSN